MKSIMLVLLFMAAPAWATQFILAKSQYSFTGGGIQTITNEMSRAENNWTKQSSSGKRPESNPASVIWTVEETHLLDANDPRIEERPFRFNWEWKDYGGNMRLAHSDLSHVIPAVSGELVIGLEPVSQKYNEEPPFNELLKQEIDLETTQFVPNHFELEHLEGFPRHYNHMSRLQLGNAGTLQK